MAQGGIPTTKERSGIWNLKNIRNAQNNAEYGQSNLYDIELLLIGGGGAGGGWTTGGGGGAGAVVYANGLSVRSGCAYPITIGSGGAPTHQNDTINSGGANSTFTYTGGALYPGSNVVITALGGGGGGNGPGLPGSYYGPIGGGSGGGGGGYKTGMTSPAFGSGSNPYGCPDIGDGRAHWPSNFGFLPGIQGFGNDGGNNTTQSGGNGGGGGAGTRGSDASCTGNGNGGRGLVFSISGSTVGYAGGGAGGGFNSSSINQGGTGFDGASPVWAQGPVPGGNPGSCAPCAPCANRGAGASGVNSFSTCHTGATGVAIIKYAGFQRGSGGNTCVTCVGSVAVNTIHTFTGSGTFTA